VAVLTRLAAAPDRMEVAAECPAARVRTGIARAAARRVIFNEAQRSRRVTGSLKETA
jgi:hypothetical protein